MQFPQIWKKSKGFCFCEHLTLTDTSGAPAALSNVGVPARYQSNFNSTLKGHWGPLHAERPRKFGQKMEEKNPRINWVKEKEIWDVERKKKQTNNPGNVRVGGGQWRSAPHLVLGSEMGGTKSPWARFYSKASQC